MPIGFETSVQHSPLLFKRAKSDKLNQPRIETVPLPDGVIPAAFNTLIAKRFRLTNHRVRAVVILKATRKWVDGSIQESEVNATLQTSYPAKNYYLSSLRMALVTCRAQILISGYISMIRIGF